MPPRLLEMPRHDAFERKASPRQNMVGISAQALSKLARRDAGKLAEPGGEMRLVAESHRGANFPEGSISRSQKMLRAVDTGSQHKLMRRCPCRTPERTTELISAEGGYGCQLSKREIFVAQVSLDIVPDLPQFRSF